MSKSDIGIQLRFTPPPHPACLDEDLLLQSCTMIQTRRGGPGGQHRNKTSTTIVLTHVPTGIEGEAGERRSQADNRRVAIRRLREELALQLRTDSTAPVNEVAISDDDEIEPMDWLGMIDRLRLQHGGKLRLAESNSDRPAVLAILLDDLVSESGTVSTVAERWRTSSSQIVRFLKEIPAALEVVNRSRRAANLRPLK